MPQSQVNFAAFAAAFVCPPPAVNDAAPAVTALAVSEQGVGTIPSWTPSRQLSCFVVSGGWRGDWYLDFQSLGGCLDAPDFLPAGSTGVGADPADRCSFYADGYRVRPGVCCA